MATPASSQTIVSGDALSARTGNSRSSSSSPEGAARPASTVASAGTRPIGWPQCMQLRVPTGKLTRQRVQLTSYGLTGVEPRMRGWYRSRPSERAALLRSGAMAGTLRVEIEGALGWIVFDHLERRNALTAQMWAEIPDAARRLAQEPAIRVVILRGAGEAAFVSGADISEFERMRSGPGAIAYDEQNTRAFEAIAAIDKPVLAMIHGFCIGGGTAIALQADLRFAADDAELAIPAAKLGLGYSPAGIDTLVRLVGPSVAKDLFFTARRVRSEEALRLGLVNAVVPKPELEACVRRTAETIAANAPLTLASVKRVMRGLARGVPTGEDPEIAGSVRACFESDDYREGVRAFLEKRPPRFHGS